MWGESVDGSAQTTTHVRRNNGCADDAGVKSAEKEGDKKGCSKHPQWYARMVLYAHALMHDRVCSDAMQRVGYLQSGEEGKEGRAVEGDHQGKNSAVSSLALTHLICVYIYDIVIADSLLMSGRFPGMQRWMYLNGWSRDAGTRKGRKGARAGIKS